MARDTPSNSALTTGSDTATANRFIGDIAITGNFVLNTLNNGDRLTGSGSDASLNVALLQNNAGNYTITPALLSNIATVNASFATIGTAAPSVVTLSLGNATGVRNVALSDSTSANAVTNIQSVLSNIGITNTNQDQSFGFGANVLSGATDAVTLGLSAVTAGTVAIGAGYETITIASGGGVNNTIAALASTPATLNITGDRGLTITGSLDAATKTINAAAATGNIDLTHTNAAVLSITGGSGNDRFTLGNTYAGGAATTANRDIINGGAGTNTLSITSAAANTTVGQANISNIQTISISDAIVNGIDLSSFSSANKLAFANTGAVSASTFTFSSGSTLDFGAAAPGNQARSYVITGTGTTDALTVTKGSAALTLGTTAQTFTGIETLNLNTNSTFGGALTIQGLAIAPTVGGISSIIATGTNDLILNGVTSAKTINGSGLTGVAGLTVAGLAAAGSIIGSSQADALAGSAAADSIDGGAGNDNIVGAAGVDTLNGGAGNDTFGYATSAEFIEVTAGNDAVIDLVDGGTGINTVSIGGGAISIGATLADTLARVTNVQTMFQSAAGASTIVITSDAALSSFRNFDLTLAGSNNATITFSTGVGTTLNAVTQAITVTGGDGADSIIGGSGADSLSGGAGQDYLLGQLGMDTLVGGNGADYLRGSNYSTANESIYNANDADLMFGGAVSVLNTTTGIYAESVNDSITGAGLQGAFSSVYAPLSTTYTDFANANIYEGRGGNDKLVATDQKDIFIYKTFAQDNYLTGYYATLATTPTRNAQNILGTDQIQNFKVGTDFLGVVMDVSGGDVTFVKGSTTGNDLSASGNGWSITASTATTATLSFDASASSLGAGSIPSATLGDFSITFVGLQNYTLGTTSVNDFFIST